MRPTDFHLYTDTQGDRVKMEGDYTYHGIRFEFSLNKQGTSDEQEGQQKRKKYRGRITVTSPTTGHPMPFVVNHPYAKTKEKQKTKVKFRQISSDSQSPKKVKESVHEAAQEIYSDNALSFARLVKNTIGPNTIQPELAGDLYAQEYIKYRYGKTNTEETLKKKLKKLLDTLAAMPFKPMSEISTAEASKALEKHPKVDISLISDFWDYCILYHYCDGNNPVIVPAAENSSAKSKQNKLQKLTRVPKQNLQSLNEILRKNPSGPDCGVALMESHVSAKLACELRWKDITWPTDDPSYAIGAFDRPDVMCAVHNYSRPLLPITALVLFARHEALRDQFPEEELREMFVVSTRSDPCKPMQPSALVQESKRLLLLAGVDQNKLLQAKESRADPVSARIMMETYKDLLLRTCGVEEGSGTQKFLCGMSINNDVSSSNYLSFSDPVGHKRLWKYLRATAPRTVYEETLCCESEGEHDIFHVKPETSDFCAGLLSNTLLLPGQEIVLSAESGLSGSVSATLAEEPANSALEPPD